MRIARVFAAAAIAASAAAYASSSDAAIVSIKVTGDVVSGHDFTDVYGYGASLEHPLDLTGTGSTFEAIFLFDTSVGRNLETVVGGTESGTATPSLGAGFSLNGGPLQFTQGSYLGRLQNFDLHGSFDLQAVAQDLTNDGAGNFHLSVLSFSFTKAGTSLAGLDQPFNFDLTSADQPYGVFAVQDLVDGMLVKQADAVLAPTHVTKTVYGVAAVPEPSGWAMMLFGFGGIGATLRRRRRAPALPA